MKMFEQSASAYLSRRERQMMEIVYRLGRATANEVLNELEDPPSYSAVRTTLGLLEKKGVLKHEQDGPRYVYVPGIPLEKVRKTALKQVLHSFFADSTGDVISALLTMPEFRLKKADVERVLQLIQRAREEGR